MKRSDVAEADQTATPSMRLAQKLAWGCQAWLWACVSLYARDLPQFREHVISADLKYGYQLVAADLNKDGREDLIAVDEAATELVWFENRHLAWERHVLASDVPRPLNVDCWDIGADGIPDVILAYRFEPDPQKSVGNVVLL